MSNRQKWAIVLALWVIAISFFIISLKRYTPINMYNVSWVLDTLTGKAFTIH